MAMPRKLFEKLSRKLNLGFLILLLHPDSYLRRIGWYRSFRRKEAVDKNGDPIPWHVYSLKFFLESRLEKTFRLFEFGSGGSTHWYAGFVKEVISVEHDRSWWEKNSVGLPPNAAILLRETEEAYVQEIKDHGLFDIVIIDGNWREECSFSAINALNDKGVIIWDDSDHQIFKNIAPEFKKRGFRELAFRGFKPVDFKTFQTSILYRDDNCLNI